MDRLPEHVTWPSTRTLVTPLIGTRHHAPDVTQYSAITAIRHSYTLLWSTFCIIAIMAVETPARACIYRPYAIITLIMTRLARYDPSWPVSDLC